MTDQGERLQKLLASLGLASRREAETWIRAGRVTLNGTIATLGVRVGARDEVRLDGRPIRRHAIAPRAAAFLANRSPGESLQHPDESGHESLMARMPARSGRRFVAVSPMPRIDGGLEIFSPDGEVAARLQRAARQVEIGFRVRVHGELPSERLASVLTGQLDSGERLAVLRCEAVGGEGSNRWYAIDTRGASGKRVRQLFERQGATVSRVLRIRFGALELDRTLPRGRSRALTDAELAALLPAAQSATKGVAVRAPGRPPSAPSSRGRPVRAGRRTRR
ncbi:MAG TPA: S4 domain-containing protein [Steroidobacteraceae bacterium]|nr:S4 domain-containing protein [Steroidobacteraceae bacterium]HQX77341.1 S4 domain-containing protein [Steroidobacteraceae bacterium]HQZ79768.1 S4 domain-containing protein [Steroidobacteraceae bacterium]